MTGELESTKWAWMDGTIRRWIQVYPQDGQLVTLWYPVDSRLTLQAKRSGTLCTNVQFDEAPDWEPVTDGVCPVVNVKRTLSVTETVEGSCYDDNRVWDRPYTEEQLRVVSARVFEVSGFEHTHRCGWCDEWVATDPTDRTRCAGCGGIGAWQAWDEPAPKIGELLPPSWWVQRNRRDR
jgi:hypothetical protein